MHFLTEPLVAHAIEHFDALAILDGPNSAKYFETFGPGNFINAKDRPHERFDDYETLLKLLRARNESKYNQIHKGTPFFFLSWLAFDLRNYEKSLYYLDAAISEDVKNDRANWITLPGALLLQLSTQPHVADRVIQQIRNLLSIQLQRFNSISGSPAIDITNFINKFVISIISNPSTRTVISAFYVFLSERSERLTELHLKSTEGGSIGPIISHLFSGGLIFESTLKTIYPKKDNGNTVETLGDVFNTATFQADFGNGFQTRATSLQEILDGITDDSVGTAFCTTARIRNTTGHNLIWDNVFDSIANYEAMADQIVNAILFIIEKKYIR